MAADPQINLDTAVQQPTISLDDGVNTSPLSTDQVNSRASKAHFALHGLLPDNFQDLHTAIATGNEDKLRGRTAAAYDEKRATDALSSLLKGNGNVQDTMTSLSKPSNPDTVLEDRYAQKYMSALNYDPMPAAWKEAINKYPDIAAAQTDVAHGLIAHSELVNKYIQDNEATISQQSYVGYGYDFLKGALIPFYNEAVAREHYTSLFGTDLERQAQEFYSMPTDEASEWLKKNYESINSHSPQLASSWLHALQGQSSSDKTLNSIGTIGDIALVGSPVVKAVGAIAKSMVVGSRAAEAVGAARTAAASAGNLAKAGEIGASEAMLHIEAGDPFAHFIDDLPSAVKSKSIVKNPGNFGQERANRLKETIDQNTAEFQQYLKDNPQIERTPDLKWSPENMSKLSEYIRDRYRFENILDVSEPFKDAAGQWNVGVRLGQSDATYWQFKTTAQKWLSLKGIKDAKLMTLEDSLPPIDKLGLPGLPSQDNAALIKHIRMNEDLITRLEAGLKSPGTAHKGKDLQDYLDHQNLQLKGLKEGTEKLKAKLNSTSTSSKLINPLRREMSFFEEHGPVYAEIMRPVDETAPFIRDTLATTEYTQSKKGFANSLIGWMRSPEDIQSPAEMGNRKIIDNAPSVLKQMFRKVGEPLTKLSKEDRVNFDRFLTDQEKTGKWADSPLELEGQYQQFSKGDNPSEHFVNSYFAYKQAKLLQHSIEQLSEYKQAHRRGNLTVRIRMGGKDGSTGYSQYFNARPIDVVPRGQGGIYISHSTPGQDKIFARGIFGDRFKKESTDLNERVRTGKARAYELDDPDSHPLNNFGKVDIRHGNRPRYIVGDNIEEQALSFSGQQFKPEVTRKVDHGFVMVKAQTMLEGTRENGVLHYVGDVAGAAHDNRATLEDLAKDFNTVDGHLAAGRMAEAEEHAKRLPISWEDYSSKYKQGRTEKGRFTSPALDAREPWHVVPSDKMLIEMPGNGIEDRARARGLDFNDTTKAQNARKQGMYELLQRRDAQDIFSVKNTGTHDNPTWDLAPVRYVDPLTSMNRAFSNTTRSLFMNDFKIASIEHWLEEGRKQDIFSREVRDSPTWNFKNPPYKTGLDAATKRQFENTKFQIEQFIGVPSKLDQTLHSWSQNLADSIYSRWNPDHYGPIARSALLTPSWLLGNLTNTADFVRSFTFNAMMGLFNPVHLFLWSMNYSNIYGIAGPIRAGQGTMGALLQQMSRWNKTPEVLDHLDMLATRMGIFKPGEWKEANAAADRYGWGLGRRELSFQPHELNPKVFQSGFNKFIDSGQIFLRGADRNLQYGAWYTAYKEYREVNAVGALTNKDWIKILDRADLLSGNMGNASRSALQNGALGFPTQFLSYQLRQWELFTGKRLTATERTRLLSTYGLLFGLPAAGGLLTGPIPVGGLPFGDRIRQVAIDNGYVTGDGAGVTTAMEGFLGQLSKLATGSYLDVGKRFGDYGIDMLRDKTMWDMIGGASYSELKNILSSTHGFWHMVQTFISGTDRFQPASSDLMDIAENFQTIAIGNRALIALNTGNWVSRNGSILEKNVSPDRAVIQSMLGLTSENFQDVYNKDATLRDQDASWKVAETEASKNYHLAIQAQQNQDPEQAHKYLQRARIILDWARVPNERWKDWMRRSSSDWESVIDSSNWKYYMEDKNIPEGQGQTRTDEYSRIRNTQ